MASLSLPMPVDEPLTSNATVAEKSTAVLLVVGFHDAVAADYAAYVAADLKSAGTDWDANFAARESRPIVNRPPREDGPLQVVDLTAPSVISDLQAKVGYKRIGDVVIFLKPRLADHDRELLAALFELAAGQGVSSVCIVSTFRVDLEDRAACEAEAFVWKQAQGLGARTVVFRPGHLLSPNSKASTLLKRLGFCYPLVPRRLRSCFVDGDELFAAIENERHAAQPDRSRFFTLLGPNRPWRDLLREHRPWGLWSACLTAVGALLALLPVGRLAGLVLDLLARRRPALRRWNFDTLRPRSFHELLALYNKYNYRHVKVVGYNNGVVHFGHRYPGKTVVSTVHCNRVIRAGVDAIKADCGATIRRARGFLAGDAQDLYVAPNYSYVCLGTSFFVPIHGSAADFSTVAETIVKVVLYDPVLDRVIVAKRDEHPFRNHVYNLTSEALLLRLILRVQPKSRYFVRREVLEGPGSDELLAALQDRYAANVEIRKGTACGSKVQICRYYKDGGGAQTGGLELPRDALGSLWDRLEQNPVTSFLMHALTRYFAWHVELFFSPEEFAIFWKTHKALPLRKIQLRFIHRDGFPYSPFRRHDCVSVDMFMLRRHRRRFEGHLKQTFAFVRSNPGKHSR